MNLQCWPDLVQSTQKFGAEPHEVSEVPDWQIWWLQHWVLCSRPSSCQPLTQTPCWPHT